jgi:hypothetical protein
MHSTCSSSTSASQISGGKSSNLTGEEAGDEFDSHLFREILDSINVHATLNGTRNQMRLHFHDIIFIILNKKNKYKLFPTT